MKTNKFLEKKTSQYALPTNPTRSGKPYPTPPRSANALETNALYLTQDCVYEEMQCTSSRVTAAISNIGSTTHFIHYRVREHINYEVSSVKKHIYSCQNKDYKGIDVTIIMRENDPVNR